MCHTLLTLQTKSQFLIPYNYYGFSSVVLVWLYIIRFSFSKKGIKEQKFSFRLRYIPEQNRTDHNLNVKRPAKKYNTNSLPTPLLIAVVHSCGAMHFICISLQCLLLLSSHS